MILDAPHGETMARRLLLPFPGSPYRKTVWGRIFVPRKQQLPENEAVEVSLGIQLLNFAEAEPLAGHTWAGAEEILDSVDLSGHPASESVLRCLLDKGWESDSVTGLLLGVWMKKAASAGDIASDLLSLIPAQRRVLTALYAASDDGNVVQYSVTGDGTLVKYVYSRKSAASPEVALFA